MTSEIEELAANTIDIAFHLHREVGPGLLESVYEAVLAKRLENEGFLVHRQVPIRVEIDGIIFPDGFRADIVVENSLIVELKSTDRLTNTHFKQTLTYVRLFNQPLGLLINFGGHTLKGNVKRIMNG